jgi:putative Mg2+ transporter-C (MgtC) family protein
MTYHFFGLAIDPTTLIGKVLVLILATLLGGMIGLERQWRGNPAGLRTHILVCVGSAVITLTSVEIGVGPGGVRFGDPAHLAAQIVSGIGFLGAGAILRDGASVHGITTAASVWTTAAIGIALGANPHLGELAVVATVIVLVTLVLLGRLETALRLTGLFRALTVCVHSSGDGPGRVLANVIAAKVSIQSLSQVEDVRVAGEGGPGDPLTRLQLTVRVPKDFDPNPLNTLLSADKEVSSFRWD